MRTGIHDIREIHRKQLDAERRYLDTGSLRRQRPSSKAEEQSPESPISPLSPFSPPPGISRLSVSAFDLKEPATYKKSDDVVLESFFGTDNMNKLNAVMQQSENREDSLSKKKSQSTDTLLSTGLPPILEKKHRPISRSPKTSHVHASTPNVSSLKRTVVGDVRSEMQQLRMKLRETANQTVAEIEERFSPKLNRLTLGPMIDLDHTSGGSHTYQCSLDSVPMVASSQSGHSRQRSLPLSVVAQVQPQSPTGTFTSVLPKSPSPFPLASHHGHSDSMSPPSRSPTPPHQQPHNRQASLSGLITTRYQNQPNETTNSHQPMQQQKTSQSAAPHQTGNGNSVTGLPHLKAPPPPMMSRQYSGGTLIGEQDQYMYGSRRSNGSHKQHQSNLGGNYGSRVYSSNPNLLDRGNVQDSTHYSTAVIRKRRSSGNKNGHSASSTNVPAQPANDQSVHSGSHASEYDHLGSTGYVEQAHHSKQSEMSHRSNRPYSTGQAHSIMPQYPSTRNKSLHQPTAHHNQRESSSDSQRTPDQIKPYMSTGELRANMKPFQYVPYTEQKRRSAAVLAYSYLARQDDSENTWL